MTEQKRPLTLLVFHKPVEQCSDSDLALTVLREQGVVASFVDVTQEGVDKFFLNAAYRKCHKRRVNPTLLVVEGGRGPDGVVASLREPSRDRLVHFLQTHGFATAA